MSLILDALNRSRRDAGQVPGLATVHYEPQPPATGGRRPSRLWAALVLALLVIAWLLADRFLPTKDTVTPAPSGPAPLAAVVPAASAPTAESPRPETPATAPVAEASPPAPRAPLPAPVIAPPPPEPAGSAPGATAPGEAPTTAAVTDLYRQRELQPADPSPDERPVPAGPAAVAAEKEAPSRVEEPVDIEQLVARAREEMRDAQLAEHDAPMITELSQQTKDGIPSLWYTRHDYTGDPARSTVTLNGKTLRAGGSVAGVQVEEVLEESVVLNFKGTRFRLRALNSWVNL